MGLGLLTIDAEASPSFSSLVDEDVRRAGSDLAEKTALLFLVDFGLLTKVLSCFLESFLGEG